MKPFLELHNVTVVKLAEEVKHANMTYGKLNSPHEAYGVLQIELNGLGAEVHARCWNKAREEAIQIAAVALRFADKLTQLEEMKVI